MEYNGQKPLRVMTLFSGYDSQMLAMRRLMADNPGFKAELVAWCEIDKNACKAHDILFPEYANLNLGDICKVDWAKAPQCDLVTWSFPCALEGTMVDTEEGYKDVSQIKAGDKVLTHAGRYMPVLRTMSRQAPRYYEIKGRGFQLRLTENHPLYVLRNGGLQWVAAKDLKSEDKAVINVPEEQKESGYSAEELWLMGRYAADGYVDPAKRNSVCFSIGLAKEQEWLAHLSEERKGKFRRVESKGCAVYRIADGRLQQMCLQFGNGAKDKRIPQWAHSLPLAEAEMLLCGYFSGDGHSRERCGSRQQMFCTVSKRLFLGLQRLILKVYGVQCSLYVRKDGRKETFSDTYNGQFNYEAKPAERVGHLAAVEIAEVKLVDAPAAVYNFAVEEDESYTCDNIVVHNCQAVSNAGLQKGLKEGSGTTSSLAYEAIKCFAALRPKFLLMENVSALLQDKFKADWYDVRRRIEALGYKNFIKVMNAKDYGVPQNRERVFMVSILKEEGVPDPRYEFPMPFKLERRLKHVLEPVGTVPEEYYLKPHQIEKIVEHCDRKTAEGCGFKPDFNDGEGVSGTLLSRYGGRETDTRIREKAPRLFADDAEDSGPEPLMLTRERTEQEKERRRLHGDKGAKFSQAKQYAPKKDGTANALTCCQPAKEGLLMEPRIEQVGNIAQPRKGFPDPEEGRVYDPAGISPAMKAQGDAKLIIVGNARPKKDPGAKIPMGTRSWIYDPAGIAPALIATDYKDPRLILDDGAPEVRPQGA